MKCENCPWEKLKKTAENLKAIMECPVYQHWRRGNPPCYPTDFRITTHPLDWVPRDGELGIRSRRQEREKVEPLAGQESHSNKRTLVKSRKLS